MGERGIQVMCMGTQGTRGMGYARVTPARSPHTASAALLYSPGKEGSHFDPNCDLFTKAEGAMVGLKFFFIDEGQAAQP